MGNVLKKKQKRDPFVNARRLICVECGINFETEDKARVRCESCEHG